jgi:proteasome lid subunit RPN8/RPN11
MRWASDDKCSVEISELILGEMIAIADEAHPLEGGASLYGHYSDDGLIAFVEGLAPQSHDAVRGRFHFRRGVAGLATFFRRLFSKTKGGAYYIGEFHSHPGGIAVPSDVDDAAQFAIADEATCHCSAPVLMIISGEPGQRRIGVFVHTRRKKTYALTPA